MCREKYSTCAQRFCKAYRHDGAHDKAVVVSQSRIIGAFERRGKLLAFVLP